MSEPLPRLSFVSLLFLSAASLGGPAAAQSDAEAASGPAPVERLAEWRAAHGATWTARVDPETGAVRSLFGGAAAPSFTPRGDADWIALALGFVAEAEPLLGVSVETLVPERVKFLPLGQVGSGDKVTVRLLQRVGGVPVRRGTVNALFLADGRLVSLESLALPGAEGIETVPTTSPERARAVALEAFARDAAGRAPTRVSTPRLVVAPIARGKTRAGALAWEVDVVHRSADPAGWTYLVAARDGADVLAREALVHQQVGGVAETRATPGTQPDFPTNPPTIQPLPRAFVTSASGTVTTEVDGTFLFPSAPGPLSVTVGFVGPFAEVFNTAGAQHVLSTSLPPGTGGALLLNPTPTEHVTAQANAFLGIVALREWVRSVDPTDDTADFQAEALVNLTLTCNAFYDGTSVNFYRAGGGCPNTAFSSVVAHEMGHWLNDRYGSGNGPDGFGEGNADVFAMYLWDDPIVGDGFFGPGTILRTGLNTKPFCGDSAPSCYGEVHTDGEVLMGALWKVRAELGAALGDALGDMTANLLFLGWMNAYDDGTIKSFVEEHWLVLDDDDGVVGNGTPHYDQIDAGFVAQGFPGFDLDFVTITNVTEVPDTLDEVGPYGVAADLAPVFAPAVASARVHWSPDGVAWNQTPMAPVSGATWAAAIPGQASPAKIRYWIEATDSLGNPEAFPDDAPAETLSFELGLKKIYFEEDFEAPGDDGWTHGQLATQDDWHHQAPAGKSGSSLGVPWSDPPQAASGTRCWGNDLGPSGFNGAYQPDVVNFLRSPSIDLSAATGATLEFQRWLTVEKSQYDVASVRVDGTEVWRNPFAAHVLDAAWQEVSIDVSALADGDPSVQLEWRLETDGGLQLGGWSVDDVRVATLDPSPTTCLPTHYGAGIPGTLGVPGIDSAGQPAKIGNLDFQVALKGGLPFADAWIGGGYSAASIVAFGGTILVLPDVIAPVALDAIGQAHVKFPLPPDPTLPGAAVHFQGVVRDPGAVKGFAMTAGLLVTFCN